MALQGSHQRNATVIAIEEPTELATLSRADYLRVFGNLDEMVWPILDILPSERTRMQLQLVYDYFVKEQPKLHTCRQFSWILVYSPHLERSTAFRGWKLDFRC